MHTSTAESSHVFSQSPSADAAGGPASHSSWLQKTLFPFSSPQENVSFSLCLGAYETTLALWLSILQFPYFAFFCFNSHILFFNSEREFTIKSWGSNSLLPLLNMCYVPDTIGTLHTLMKQPYKQGTNLSTLWLWRLRLRLGKMLKVTQSGSEIDARPQDCCLPKAAHYACVCLPPLAWHGFPSQARDTNLPVTTLGPLSLSKG